MPKNGPAVIQRNEEIKAKFTERYQGGVKKLAVYQQLAKEYNLTPETVSLIVRPPRLGRKGGKFTTREEYLKYHQQYGKKYRAKMRRKKNKELNSEEMELNPEKKELKNPAKKKLKNAKKKALKKSAKK